MNTVTATRTWLDLLPPSNEQRAVTWRRELVARPDYSRQIHDARINLGITLISEWKARPVPKHRALTIINTAPGGNPAEDYEGVDPADLPEWHPDSFRYGGP